MSDIVSEMALPHLDRDSDVVVLGSGAAALAAALAAAEKGAAVTVLEKASQLGGTTSVSGGLLWVPLNSHMRSAGINDSRAAAVAYLTRLAAGQVHGDIIETYVDRAAGLVDHLEGITPLRFAVMSAFPDYRQEFEGALAAGRGLETLPFDANQLGDHSHAVRISPFYTALTLSELKGGVYDPSIIPWTRAAERMRGNIRTLGSALVCGLLKACLDRGVRVLTETPARRLLVDGDRVAGVVAEHNGEECTFRAARAVVLGSGGFDWNQRLKSSLLGIGDVAAVGVPTNEGDGLVMALRTGAALTGVREAWWEVVSSIPTEQWPEGGQMFRPNVAERTLPGSIMVNRAGRRFVNEAMNYHDLSRSLMQFDTATYTFPDNPAWTVFDQSFKDRYVVMTAMPGEPAPEWLPRADTLEELAELVGIDPDGLATTVSRFNGFARSGVDADFHRGESAYDRYQSDPRHGPNPSLGTIGDPPFYALETRLGMVGTKTGLSIDPRARVLDVAGHPIAGLLACSNLVAAATTGPAIAGPGGTLGPAVVFGYIAGETAAGG
jgi:succinate dehydrogenase/fumarate reductase flavoprotein subunit